MKLVMMWRHFLHRFTNASRETTIHFVLLLLWVVPDGWGYPGGAPDVSCLSLLPTGHGVDPRTSDPPYKIFVSRKSYKPGETLQVVIQAEGENYFRGLILQARMTGCNVTENRVVGTFTNTDTELETRHCFGEIHSTVTHNSAIEKRLKTFYWTAPVISAGHVVMRATFLREFQEYWSSVESEIIVDLHAQVSSKCIPGAPALITTQFSLRHTSSSSAHETSTLHSRGLTTKGQSQRSKGESTTQSGKPPGKTPPAGDNYPTWLGPSFERKSKPEDSTGGGEPSWLIPAYQKASSGAASWDRGFKDVELIALVLLRALWTITPRLW